MHAIVVYGRQEHASPAGPSLQGPPLHMMISCDIGLPMGACAVQLLQIACQLAQLHAVHSVM
jgi:hypothetical protein